ncbi:CYTH-like domain-containing protein [Podospora australis]|uniref:mRNA-capping enzyme subunit beta n=1 Tax=Podospora australis TaxID=1536484 RepID=A0AAN6WWJ8_9PEZI|nr:CYTH-like domain-containing protein [Podospora australis]
MDLRGMLNDNGGPPASTPTKPPLQLPSLQPAAGHGQQQHSMQQSPLPSTPIQAIPQPAFRDYNPQPLPSPSRHVSHDYGGAPLPPSGAFASPPQYPNSGPYASRPPPPPIQPMPSSELRSPSVGSGPIPPSPYRQTPVSSVSTSAGYPFPPSHQTPTSPVQRHQYPQARDSYSRDVYGQPAAPVGMTGPPVGAPSYMQGPHVPQTPPIGTPGGHQSYLQRSQSTHSTSTPTSAHSQPGPYGAPFVHGSPVAAAHPLPQPDQRQSSQPPTPGGAASFSARPPHATGSFAQPSSPYQQRLPSNVTGYHPGPSPSQTSSPAPTPAPPAPPTLALPRHTSIHSPASATSFHSGAAAGEPSSAHTSPPLPPPPSLPRHSSIHSIYDPHPHPEAATQQGPPPQSDRDRSLSVSPKTRVPSLPSTFAGSGRPGSLGSDFESRTNPIHPPQPPPQPSMAPIKEEDTERDRAYTPAKRKLADRDLHSDELERRETRPPPFKDANGRVAPADSGARPSEPSLSAKAAVVVKKRKIYKMPPPWAQSIRDQPRLGQSRNAILYRPVAHSGASLANGKSQPNRQASRHTSPEERRANPPPPAAHAPAKPDHASYGLPGPWENNLANLPLQDTTAAALADWLYTNVIDNPDIEEIEGRNIKFEIEAKLGTLVAKNTNLPLDLPVETECLLRGETGNWLAFKASMTVVSFFLLAVRPEDSTRETSPVDQRKITRKFTDQHRFFNKFLNQLVSEAHPDNPKNKGPGSQPRVPIEYIHRREIDRFVELTPDLCEKYGVPDCITRLVRNRGNRGVRLRVTHEDQSNKVIARIVKARIADASIYFPHSLDCRISVNLEWDWDGPVDELDHLCLSAKNNYRRDKDRMSYKHGFYQVDLTQVKTPQPNATREPSKEHELEVELDAPVIVDQGRRHAQNRPNQYLDLVTGFLSNIKLLAREARKHSSM